MIGALPTIGPTELMILLGIVVILFGARKLPELARSLGQALNELRNAANEEDEYHGGKSA